MKKLYIKFNEISKTPFSIKDLESLINLLPDIRIIYTSFIEVAEELDYEKLIDMIRDQHPLNIGLCKSIDEISQRSIGYLVIPSFLLFFGIKNPYYYEPPFFCESKSEIITSLEKRVELIDRILETVKKYK